jgi:hypothetical protein
MSSNDTSPPGEFTPNENVQSPELQEFFDKLPLDLIVEAVPGTYGSYPAVLLPEGDYSQYLTGNERIINHGKNVLIVFGNPQSTPQPQQQPQLTPTSQPHEQQSQVENSNIELNNLEKILNIELYPYIPDWLKPYLNKYGLMQGEKFKKEERKEFAEKLWKELQKNWDKILELLDVNNDSVPLITVLTLDTKFPSEYKGSRSEDKSKSRNVKEETKGESLSKIFYDIRQNYSDRLLDSFAPAESLSLRVIRPMTPKDFKRCREKLNDVVQLYKDAYLIFSFANMFKINNKKPEQVKGADLKEASPEKLKYLQDLVDAYKRLKSAGLNPPLIVDANNTLVVGSLNELSPNGNYTVLRINDLDLSQANEERLKDLESSLNFVKKAFDHQYGARFIKVRVNPSVLDLQVFKIIVKLLEKCSEGNEICLYKARRELSALPESHKVKFINNLANTLQYIKYRIKYINLFATLLALVNYYDHLLELKKDEEMNYDVAKYSQSEEEKAKRILKTVKQGFKIS